MFLEVGKYDKRSPDLVVLPPAKSIENYNQPFPIGCAGASLDPLPMNNSGEFLPLKREVIIELV